MIVQLILVRDSDNKTLESPKWEINDSNEAQSKQEIELYLSNNPSHYIIFGQKWVDNS